jgi:PAT family beta-lactamase induction signal transducer AmpG
MPRPAWLEALLNRRMLICVFTGFSSGLPLYLLLNLVPAWLYTEGISIKAIGLLALMQIPYIWKFLWSPLLDRFALPRLGRRRGWMAATQILLLMLIAGLGLFSPSTDLQAIVVLATLLSFVSATQDIALDAYRRELLPDHELGLGNSVHVNAYRIAGLVPGSLSLILADHLPWGDVFAITALFMLPGLAMTLLVSEKVSRGGTPRTLREAVVEPFREFLNRAGWREALLMLAFIFFYKLGDSLCTALATPFYLSMGFAKSEIGLVAKHAGLWPAVIGGLLGGLWMVKLGINRALWLFGVVQLVSIFGFAWLAWLGPNMVVGAEQLMQLALVIGRLGHRSLRRLHRARHQPALHRHAVRAFLQSRRGTAHTDQLRCRLSGRADGLVHFLPALRGACHSRHAVPVQGCAVAARRHLNSQQGSWHACLSFGRD